MHRNCILIVFFAVFLGLASAQNTPTGAETQDRKSFVCPPEPTPEDIAGGTRKFLACEWLDSNAAPHILEAMALYIEGEKNFKQAVDKVLENAPANQDAAADPRWFYKAALGVRDKNGQPTTQGMGAFLEMLATANTRMQDMSSSDKDRLFKEADDVIK